MHLSAAEGSERAAHLALLSGHARANGGAGQGIESVTDDQVTLRRHWRRTTKGAFHRDLGRREGARGFARESVHARSAERLR